MYNFGSAYFLIVFTVILTCAGTAYICLPVFYKLQLQSTYEYLEIRFSHDVRILASILYIISLLMYIPIVIYVPALAFSQVTGYSLYVITPVLCSICILYTSLVRIFFFRIHNYNSLETYEIQNNLSNRFL